MKFKPGYKVIVDYKYVKSSPIMIVDDCVANKVTCFWFTEDGYYHRAIFHKNMLTTAE